MADKPEKFPDWALEDEVDPVSGQLNVVEPPAQRFDSGWARREIPPRQWMNWLLRKSALWFRWLEDRIEGLQYASEAEALAGTAEDRVIAPARFGDNSLTTNGYQVLPGGLILQWGLQPFSGSGTESATVTFPIEFPNAILSATVSHAASTGNNPDSVYHDARTNTSMTVGITGDTSTDVMWQAIGY